MAVCWQKLLKSWIRPSHASRRRSLQKTVAADVWQAERLETRSFPSAVGFDTPVEVMGAGAPPKEVALGDLDGDGITDLVVGVDAGWTKVFWGDGRGSFGRTPSHLAKFTYAPLAAAPQIADFNGDGKLDLLIAEATASNFLLYLGNGTRTLGRFVQTTVGGENNYVTGLTTEDVNGDGARDVIVMKGALSNTQSQALVYLNDRRGGFSLASAPITLASTDVSNGGSIAAGDVTGDGRVDVVIARNDNVLTLLVGRGDGSFQTPQTINRQTSRGSDDVHLADFNGDRRLDLVVADRNANSVWVGLNNGTGQFSFRAFGTGDYPVRLVVADIDGDQRADIVTTNPGPISSLSSARGDTVTLLKGLGNGQFEAGQDFSTGNRQDPGIRPFGIATTDLNRDGILDVVVGHNMTSGQISSSVTVLKGRLATPTGGTIRGQVFVDMNGNGVRDTGEAGLSGRTVYLDANNNGSRDSGERTALSDASGNYSFTALVAGSYTIAEELVTGWSQTKPTANGRYQTQIAASETKTGFDFGNFQAMTIRGSVFIDANRNGRRDVGELGRSGWWVFLDNNANGKYESGELIKRTDTNGIYSFTGLGVGPIVNWNGPERYYRVLAMSPNGAFSSNTFWHLSRSGKDWFDSNFSS